MLVVLTTLPAVCNAQEFTDNIRVDDDIAANNAGGASIAIESSGKIHIIWTDRRDDINGDVFYANSTDWGRTFSTNLKVNDDATGKMQSVWGIAVDSTGKIHVVWEDWRNNNGDVYYANSTDGGITFNKNVKVNDDGTGTTRQGEPKIAVDNTGKIHVAWLDTRNGNGDIYYSNSTDGGITFNKDVMVNSYGLKDQGYPDIAVDSDGKIHVVWDDTRNDPGGIPPKLDIYYANSTDGGITFNGDVMVNDGPPGSVPRDAPFVAIDDNNKIHVVWGDARNGNYDIYYANSTDGGITFSSDRRINDDSTNTAQVWGKIAANGSKICIVWYDFRNDPDPFDGIFENADVYFANSTDAGITFSSNIRINDDNTLEDQRNPSIVVDSSGNSYIAWHDRRSGNYDIYFAWSNKHPPMAQPISPANGLLTTNTMPILDSTSVIDAEGDEVQYNFTIADQSDAESGVAYYSGWISTSDWITPSLNDGKWYWHTYSKDPYSVTAPDWVWNFTVDTSVPNITHIPITTVKVGESIIIEANITDGTGVVNATLYYENVGDTSYTDISMTLANGTNKSGNWTAVIPLQTKTGFVHYFIWANDTLDNNITAPIMGDYAIQITGPPAIEITNPLGGEDWTGGSVHQIEFVASDTEDNPENLTVFLNYTSVSGGDGIIATINGDDTPYDWTLPNIDATDVKVNVTVIDSYGDTAYDDSPIFTIDYSPPEVISTNPANNTTGISIYQPIVIQFNEAMNTSSVEFIGLDIAWGWSWFWNDAGDIITGIHDPLNRGVPIGIYLVGGYKDDSDPGNANNTAYEFSFTTETDPSPEIVHTNISSPQELGDEIKVNATITDDGIVMNAVLWLWDVDDNWIESNMNKNGDDWEYIITGQMKEGRVRYMINATDDLGQKNTTAVYDFYIVDTTSPVISHTPVESALIGNPINITCQVTDLGRVNTSTVYFVYRYEGDSEFMIELMNPEYWFEIPAHSVPATIEYYLQASDIYGNDVSTQLYSLEIIDPAVPDTTPARILFVSPTGHYVSISTNISIVFSEAMNISSVENAVSISPTLSSFSFIWLNNQTLTIVVSTNLSYNTTYSITVGTDAEDLAGNGLVSSHSWNFVTEPEPIIVSNPPQNDYLRLVAVLCVVIVVLCLWSFYQTVRERKEPEE
ncbi:MAG: Ig-like domain-containing protein [Thermoplasmata archaeon]|nr:Ig-like domain-containing protein [Thermoplasmata archaeon]